MNDVRARRPDVAGGDERHFDEILDLLDVRRAAAEALGDRLLELDRQRVHACGVELAGRRSRAPDRRRDLRGVENGAVALTLDDRRRHRPGCRRGDRASTGLLDLVAPRYLVSCWLPPPRPLVDTCSFRPSDRAFLDVDQAVRISGQRDCEPQPVEGSRERGRRGGPQRLCYARAAHPCAPPDHVQGKYQERRRFSASLPLFKELAPAELKPIAAGTAVLEVPKRRDHLQPRRSLRGLPRRRLRTGQARVRVRRGQRKSRRNRRAGAFVRRSADVHGEAVYPDGAGADRFAPSPRLKERRLRRNRARSEVRTEDAGGAVAGGSTG